MNDEYTMLVRQLSKRYLDILQKESDALCDLHNDKSFSGVFLPQAPSGYLSSEHKVLIIGQEPRQWKRQLINGSNISKSMEKTMDTLARKKAGSSKFLQFYKRASKNLCGNDQTAAWANQFCMSYNKRGAVKIATKDPCKFQAIKRISSDLLKTQFEILKPNAAIFTTGSSRDKYIKETFPEYQTEHVIVAKRLWYFKIGNTHCFRTNHPCAYNIPKLQMYLKKSVDYTELVLNGLRIPLNDF